MQAGAVCPPILQQIVEHESIPLLGLDRQPLLPTCAECCISLVLHSTHMPHNSLPLSEVIQALVCPDLLLRAACTWLWDLPFLHACAVETHAKGHLGA